jgi:hypothetical protein
MRDQGVEAGGDPGRVRASGCRRRPVCVAGDPFKRRLKPRGGVGRIFVLSQSPLRRLRSDLRFNQPTA